MNQNQNYVDLINYYFNKLVFVKSDQKENYIIYAALISASYADGKKQYILAFVPVHLAILNKAYLYELPWINLQTRLLKSYHKLVPQKWDIPSDVSKIFFATVERDVTHSKYRSEDNLPIEILLLNDTKKKTKFQYWNRMTLLACLTSFQCVLNIERQFPSFEGNQLSNFQEQYLNENSDGIEYL